jgi:hypothetical protein
LIHTPIQANDFKTLLQVLYVHTQINLALTLTPTVFDCTVFVHLQKEFHSKLEPIVEKDIDVIILVHKNIISQWM